MRQFEALLIAFYLLDKSAEGKELFLASPMQMTGRNTLPVYLTDTRGQVCRGIPLFFRGTTGGNNGSASERKRA